MRHRIAIFTTLAAAILVAGCTASSSNDDSSGKFQGEQRLVANTIEDFESAASKGDEDEICRRLLAREAVQALGGAQGCPAKVNETLKDTDTFDLTVESMSVTSARATARVKTERGDKDRIETLVLVRQGPGWRIAQFGGAG